MSELVGTKYRRKREKEKKVPNYLWEVEVVGLGLALDLGSVGSEERRNDLLNLMLGVRRTAARANQGEVTTPSLCLRSRAPVHLLRSSLPFFYFFF